MELLFYSGIVLDSDSRHTKSVGIKKIQFSWLVPAVTQLVKEVGEFDQLGKEDVHQKRFENIGQEGCNRNQDNVIISEDIQTSVVADSREVYQQGEIYNGTNRRTRTLTEKDKEYQQKILFEKRKKLHARMARKSC